MSEPLLPTPQSNSTRKGRGAMVENQQWSAPGLEQVIEIAAGQLPREFETWDEVPGWHRRTSASSPGSEDSTSRSIGSDTDASDRSSGTSPAGESSSDGGPTFPSGEMLLPTPHAQEPGWTVKPEHHARLGKRSHPDDHLNRTWGLQQVVDVLTSSAEGSPASQSAPPADAGQDRTSGGSGPSSPVWLASYDPERSSSRTSEVSYRLVTWTRPQASLFGDLPSERFSETWPTSGMTLDGRVYELPTSALLTNEPESSSLPTPQAHDAAKGNATRVGRYGTEHGGRNLNDDIDLLRTVHGMSGGTDGKPHDGHGSELSQQVRGLLPTPTSRDHKGRNQRDDESCLTGALLPAPVADHSRGLAQPGTDYQSLPNAVMDLLPTPRVGGMSHGYGEQEVQEGDPKHRLEARIEVLRRSPGDPTNPPSEGGSE